MYILKFVKNCHYASKMLNIKIPLLNTKKNRALVLSSFSPTQLFATLWNVAHMAPLSMGFSRQEHWSGLPCPLPGDLPDSGTDPQSPALWAGSLSLEPLVLYLGSSFEEDINMQKNGSKHRHYTFHKG